MIESRFEARSEPPHALDEVLLLVREKAGSVRFGTITLTIHEGRPTQLEVSEKRRFGG